MAKESVRRQPAKRGHARPRRAPRLVPTAPADPRFAGDSSAEHSTAALLAAEGLEGEPESSMPTVAAPVQAVDSRPARPPRLDPLRPTRSRHWVRQVVVAQESERRRISRELHDKVGQDLAALILGLKEMRKSAKRGATSDALGRLERIAEVVGQDVHNLAADLRPSALDDFGVARALGNYVEDWASRAGVSVDFHASGLDGVRFPTEVETTAYRVVQEALANVAKHARARHVSVLLEHQDGDLIAIVEDDGAGFEFDGQMKGHNRGLGLGVIKERAGLVDGTVEIETAAGQGTTVFLRIPLPLPEKVDA